MVNIAGRSKGCKTCRQKRVKCDETRPSCQRCQRLGLDCSGPAETAFIEANIVQSRRRKPKNDMLSSTKTDDSGADVSAPNPLILSKTTLKPSELDIYICHTQKHLCIGGALNDALSGIHLLNLETICKSSSNQLVSHQAVLSFAIITFGAQQKQQDITNKGYAMYSTAVSGLNQALSFPALRLCDQTILAVTALAFLEALVPSGPETYEHHVKGLERLLEIRGLTKYRSTNISQLYRFIRAMIVFTSLRKGKQSMFAGAGWKAAFRLHSSNKEHLEQDLYDALADCTTLVAMADEPCPRMVARQIEETVWSIIAHIRAFQARCGWRSEASCHEFLCATSWMTELRATWMTGPPVLMTTDRSIPTIDVTMLYYLVFIRVFRALDSLVLENCQNNCGHSWLVVAERSAALKVLSYAQFYVAEKSRYKLSSPHPHLALTTAFRTLGGTSSIAGRRIRDILQAPHDDIVADSLWLC